MSGFSGGKRAWKRRWADLLDRYERSETENATLRLALDELNADVEEFLNVAHQTGHEAAKSWLIKAQQTTIRRMRAEKTKGIT